MKMHEFLKHSILCGGSGYRVFGPIHDILVFIVFLRTVLTH